MQTLRRHRHRYLSLLFLCLSLATAMAAEARDCKTLTATGNPEYPPYLWRMSADGDQLIGAIPRILEEIGERIGVEINVIYTGPWSRAQQEVREGSVDLMAGAFFTVPRAQWMDYIHPPFLATNSVVWVRQDNGFEYRQWDDLRPLNGVTVIHNSFGQSFDEFARQHLDLETVRSVRQGFRMLRLGRVDYMLYEKNPAVVYSRQMGISDDVKPLSTAISSEPLHFAVSHESPCNTGALRGQLVATVVSLIDEGFIDRALRAALEDTSELKQLSSTN
ncbi:amino acid ABC transporter substrate-binding protein (PAAT family) [Tamilnaduibacter salinus]|uniref:Amino acid ABC transporter substrate-binding protein (PAAT family) n=2 Tax=Tamilnaduibacter salinus TaxID=1484056 RepID=A0A2U1CX69_9GAMM|nr:amino acid ABC transporter substrate-binding protein (PAAT family) [Tamilnaduibacter salinus]